LTRITIAAVGRRAPGWVQAGFAEYKKRLSSAIDLKLVEVRPGPRGKTGAVDKVRRDEAAGILKAVPTDNTVIALDEKGKRQTTAKFSACLNQWINDGRDVCFIIGGADGLDPSVLDAADEVWSLSDYTLPHALVRVILAEQIYRAWSIINKHPYHRE
jgi:23S rRNA (pseudouridine1915-N3)-methyltransferase